MPRTLLSLYALSVALGVAWRASGCLIAFRWAGIVCLLLGFALAVGAVAVLLRAALSDKRPCGSCGRMWRRGRWVGGEWRCRKCAGRVR